MECRERMEQYLQENNVPYEVMTHDQAYTMQEAAAALHVSGKRVAKVVMVKADGQMAMVVIPAPHRLNLDHVRAALDVKKVGLAKEKEFSGLFPDCEPGAMPPFGNLYDVPVHVDRALALVRHELLQAVALRVVLGGGALARQRVVVRAQAGGIAELVVEVCRRRTIPSQNHPRAGEGGRLLDAGTTRVQLHRYTNGWVATGAKAGAIEVEQPLPFSRISSPVPVMSSVPFTK